MEGDKISLGNSEWAQAIGIQRKQIDYTTGNLGISATYISNTFNSKNYKLAQGFVYSDQVINVAYEFSEDGSTWSRTASAASVANQALNLSVTIPSQYFRFVLINGATATTTLRSAFYALPV